MDMSQRGLNDWIIQRMSALVMIAYFGFLFGFFVGHYDGLTFERWHLLFASLWMKVATLVVLLLLLWHAWVGLWTITTDYLKCPIMRASIQMSIMLALLGFFFWGLLVMWSV